jgi:hypothetical protein
MRVEDKGLIKRVLSAPFKENAIMQDCLLMESFIQATTHPGKILHKASSNNMSGILRI